MMPHACSPGGECLLALEAHTFSPEVWIDRHAFLAASRADGGRLVRPRFDGHVHRPFGHYEVDTPEDEFDVAYSDLGGES